MWADFTHHEHAAGVTMVTVFDDGHVYVQHVAFFQGFVIWDPMTNHMVD